MSAELAEMSAEGKQRCELRVSIGVSRGVSRDARQCVSRTVSPKCIVLMVVFVWISTVQ